jgi:hypothetical protein
MAEVLQQGGTVELTVTGNSMYPMLRHRVSRVRLAPVTGPLSRGDLPLYRRDNGKFVLHRVVEVDNGLYSCCGDNQWHVEPGIRHDQIIAIVTDYARRKSWVSCGNRFHRIYWRFWVWVRPLRRLVFGGWKRVRRIIGR